DVLNEIKKLSQRIQTQDTVLKSIKDSLPRLAPTPMTFAQATATSRPTIQNRPNRRPIRYIVRFQGNPPTHAERLTSERATRRINDRLRELDLSQDLLVLGVECKPNGNYAIAFSNTSSEARAEEHKNILAETLAPNHPSVTVSRDVPWTRIIVHGISV